MNSAGKNAAAGGCGWEFRGGRLFLGRLPKDDDLAAAVAAFCEVKNLSTAFFSISGSLSSAVYGVYDPKQQVYITSVEEKPLEILSCRGSVSLKGNKPSISAQIVLADDAGRLSGGRLFSPSRIFFAEIILRELVGEGLERKHDDLTGLDLWAQSTF